MSRSFSVRTVLTIACCLVFGMVMSAAVSAGSASNKSDRTTRIIAQAAGAVDAFFQHSDLDRARKIAAEIISETAIGPQASEIRQARLDALFIEMEAASLEADVPGEIEAALQICESVGVDRDDRAEIAAQRLVALAGNTPLFRSAVPRIQKLIANESGQTNYLRAALLRAATDGLPGLSVLHLARESGLVTEWTVSGPFGKYPNIAFDQTWPPEHANPPQEAKSSEERFQFPDGTFRLPEYFPTAGVLYASADIKTDASLPWRLRVESRGTLQVLVDGVSVLVKDARYRAGAETAWTPLQLPAGHHVVLVKFLPSGSPFRVALLPVPRDGAAGTPIVRSAFEASYIKAARSYWVGDYLTAIDGLSQLRRDHESAAVDFLLFKAQEHADPTSAEIPTLLRSAQKEATGALAVEQQLAVRSMNEGNANDAFARTGHILAARPQFEPAARLGADAAKRLHWTDQASRLYELAAKLHPSCPVLKETSSFFASILDYNRSDFYAQQLQQCAPASLDWAQSLAEKGEYRQAADAAEQVVSAYPLNRDARAFLVHQLSMAGDKQQALQAARELATMSPHSVVFTRMASQLASGADLFDDHGPFARDGSPFYAPYERDAFTVIEKTSKRHFSGGPAVALLEDRVAKFDSDGTVDVYVHSLTRVLNRDGVLKFGEVALPPGADLLELRTIKPDGTTAEPDLTAPKATISMPGLATGDVIDVEYVLHYHDGVEAHADELQFTFGSFAEPILYSQFVVVAPQDSLISALPTGNVPTVQVEQLGHTVVRTWKRDNILQSVREVSMPPDVLPAVRILPSTGGGWPEIRDFYRNALINAIQAGSHVDAVARSITGATDEERLSSAFRLVTERVRPLHCNYALGQFVPAETTLANFAGSRTMALIAVAQAMGIHSDLLLTRDIGSPVAIAAAGGIYSRPLIVFHAHTKDGDIRDIVVDAETEGIGFGGIAASIARSDALDVPLQSETATESAKVIVPVPAPVLDNHSVAEGDVRFDNQGNLSARVTIRMGASRSSQMRTILAGVPQDGRKHFFEQLAMRIFPGATDATGRVHNEFDPSEPLVLEFECQAPHFADLSAGTADIDQLVPTLGLRKMYVSAPARRMPLYIATPLVETSTFRIRLRSGQYFSTLPPDMVEKNEFGTYSVTFRREAPNVIEVRRDFRIPVQVIAPSRFEQFAGFAYRIDDAERERLTIGGQPLAAGIIGR